MTILSMNDSGPVDSNIYGMDSDQKRYDSVLGKEKKGEFVARTRQNGKQD